MKKIIALSIGLSGALMVTDASAMFRGLSRIPKSRFQLYLQQKAYVNNSDFERAMRHMDLDFEQNRLNREYALERRKEVAKTWYGRLFRYSKFDQTLSELDRRDSELLVK